MNELINFDALQEEYISAHLDMDKYKGLDEEARLARAYHDAMHLIDDFIESPCDALAGKSPLQHFQSMPTYSLMEDYIAYFEEYGSAPDVLNNVLMQRKDCEEELLALVQDDLKDIALRMNSIALLEEMQSTKAAPYFAELQLERAQEDELADRAFEALRSLPEDFIIPILLPLFAQANRHGKEAMLDILAVPDCDESVFHYVLMAYAKAKTRKEIYAHYLGQMENEAALPVLQEAVQSGELDYIDYMETRVAIERLGGVCEELDFSEDPLYKQVKERF